MSLQGLTDWGPTGALELLARFSGARQRLIAHNVANLSTPGFLQMDLSTRDFQDRLGRALDEQRSRGGTAPFSLESGGEFDVNPDGSLTTDPRTPSKGVLLHDRNNRDLERLMQDQAENLMVYRTAMDLLRSRAEMMRSALGQRV
jgi:flagellar basal-body rod protein FlgB